MHLFNNIYKNRKIFITGHTGFKGGWLTFWLLKMGANITGYSLNTFLPSSNFNLLNLKKDIHHISGDIRNYKKLENSILKFKPELIFHLAAQSLVSKSYVDPHETYLTNTVGTLNLMNILSHSKYTHKAVIITSDKVYKNVEKKIGYKENDIIGGLDPYSSSKSCAELIANSYACTLLNKDKSIVTVRAGNVIGGGDWNEGRIVPDVMRAYISNKTAIIRNPNSTRPWQHVLEPLSGYLLLGQKLIEKNKFYYGQSYNFGPSSSDKEVTVRQLLKALNLLNSKLKWKIKKNQSFHESKLLSLDCKKAKNELKWKRILHFKELIKLTNDWYSDYKERKITKNSLSAQIDYYIKLARMRKACWVK